MKNKQQKLFEADEKWKEEWQDMPEFVQNDLTSWKSIIVHFETEQDMIDFSNLIGQKLTSRTRSIWYPPAEIGRIVDKIYTNEKKENES